MNCAKETDSMAVLGKDECEFIRLVSLHAEIESLQVLWYLLQGYGLAFTGAFN